MSESVMIHTPTGATLSVDYWMFREILREASQKCCNQGDFKHADLCDKIVVHLQRTR